MIRLLDRCVSLLASQGASKLFVDAIKWGTEGFEALGNCFPDLFSRSSALTTPLPIRQYSDHADKIRNRLRVSKMGAIQRSLAGGLTGGFPCQEPGKGVPSFTNPVEEENNHRKSIRKARQGKVVLC